MSEQDKADASTFAAKVHNGLRAFMSVTRVFDRLSRDEQLSVLVSLIDRYKLMGDILSTPTCEHEGECGHDHPQESSSSQPEEPKGRSGSMRFIKFGIDSDEPPGPDDPPLV
jgi:hypothetical protein